MKLSSYCSFKTIIYILCLKNNGIKKINWVPKLLPVREPTHITNKLATQVNELNNLRKV